MRIISEIKQHKVMTAAIFLEIAVLLCYLLLFFTPSNNQKTDGAGFRVDGLFPGLYEVSVDYEAYGDGVQIGSVDVASSNPKRVLSTPIYLEDGHFVKEERVWVRPSLHRQSVVVNVNYAPSQLTNIASITFKCHKWYILTSWLGLLAIFALADVFVCAMAGVCFSLTKDQKLRVILLMGIACVASLPAFADFLFAGHDLVFHLSRINGIAQGIGDGQIPIRMFTHAFNEHGYVVPVFYGEILLYFPALLYILGMTLQSAYQCYILAINVATVLIAYNCFKKITQDEKLGLLAAFLYTICPYRFMDMYVRASLGEYTALTFLPLIVYGFWKIYTTNQEQLDFRCGLPVIIGLSGLIESHTLSCGMAAIFIIAFVIIKARKTFEKRRLKTLITSALATLALNLGFIVPFLDASKMELNIKLDDEISMASEGLGSQGAYLKQILAVFHPGDGSSNPNTAEGDMALTIGAALMIGLLLSVAMLAIPKNKKDEDSTSRSAGVISAIFAIASIALSTAYFPWNRICAASSKLGHIAGMLQFPWRFLAIAMPFAVLATVLGIQRMHKYSGVAVAVLVGVCLITEGAAGVDFVKNKERGVFYSANDINNMQWDNLYLPQQTDVFAMNLDRAVVLSGDATVSDMKVKGTVKTVDFETQNVEATIKLPVLYYDNYRAKIAQTGEPLIIEKGSNNDIQVKIPGGKRGTIKLWYQEPLGWRMAEFVSLMSIITLLRYLTLGKIGPTKGENVLEENEETTGADI